MNNELYNELCDDAQQLLGLAQAKVLKVKTELLKSGNPGVRLANRNAGEIADSIKEIKRLLDLLPAVED